MLRFLDPALEDAVEETSRYVDGLAADHKEARRQVPLDGRTRLLNTAPSTQRFRLGDWLGAHRVPARVAEEPVTVVRSVEGFGLACAPSLSPRRFSDPTLDQGEDGKVLLAALAAFERPATVASAVAELGAKVKLHPAAAREVIEHLVAGRFLQPAAAAQQQARSGS